MDGLDAIKEKILADARSEAAQISRQTDKVIQDMMLQNKAECDQLLASAQNEAAESARIAVNRAESLASLDLRKRILAARRSIIDQVLEAAVAQLARLSPAQKKDMYLRLIEKSGLDSGTLVLNETDRNLADSLIAESGRQLTLDGLAGTFAGGLIIRQPQIEENLTFETLLRNNLSEWISLASEKLFAPDENKAPAET